MYRIITTKKLNEHSLHFLLPLTFASLCFPYKTPSAVSQHVWTLFSTVPFSHLGTILMELFSMFIGDSCLVFRGKNPNGNAENEVNDMLHPIALCDETGSRTILL
jgi:hypothetical protein